ncbi:ABC transporter permease [Clostridium algidicarnis]|uniref:ABC transporter permease n=1 Tax=Clostridium algidicarnis TaxID=37659 RepID=UPI001C0E1DE7|nr:ABC transporter permease [Clostridium algidicarnis]MBU3204958.1 ABC transporter permease [Clostridium algidicarnis]MBU3213112.1 ABC transporter permease [Clostridium algidicarnis]MBU3223167.1 ABC transporter permease [Clostridium algidicarnis]MBU3227329.1 ABC transporter permease [Clostridium algidicarnis]MBU3250852.1 ABC transporter permease [Clostridium algidicarnis]
MNIFSFFVSRWKTILDLTIEHLVMVSIAMVISIIVGTTVGILITRNKKIASIILSITNIMMTIPSLALFSLLIPILGIGKEPAIFGLVVYTQLPIVRNVYTGIININPSIIEAARGMGLTEKKILYKIKIPLAFPSIMSGIRTAVVMGIGIGAIGGYIGAGGLGVYIFQGISRTNDKMILIGAILISLIAIVADKALGRVEKKYQR